MNKRIKELALKARLGSVLLLHHWGAVHALTDSEQNELEQIENFAELIIRECSKVAWQHTPDTEELEYSHLIKDKILTHFGVEE